MKPYNTVFNTAKAAILILGVAICSLTAPHVVADPVGSKDGKEAVNRELLNANMEFNKKLAKELSKEANKAQITIEQEHIVAGMEGGAMFAVAPSVDVESLNADLASKGIQETPVGFAFITSPSPNSPLPTGFYSFKFSASPESTSMCFDESMMGTPGANTNGYCDQPASVDIIDKSGKVVLTVPAKLQRLIPPDPTMASRPFTFADAAIIHQPNGPGSQPGITIQIWIQAWDWRGCWVIPLGRRILE